MKLVEVGRELPVTKITVVESGLEASYATYMSGVYKIPMVRMSFGLTKLRTYGSISRNNRNVVVRIRKYMRLSKNFFYERPYCISGAIQYTGSEEYLRVYVQIEISERGKVGIWS